jgi:pyruvate/2-oxoglutarate/acetoin dehydrogenase E1 component
VVTVATALRAGLHGLMADDARVHVLGEDVLDPYGGAFKVTAGLSDAYPDRVHTTPISESAVVGVGVGMALRGLRPVIEIMFGDFLTLAVDPLVNSAAKFRAMFGRPVPVPLVVRTPMGGRRGYGPTHSQTLETLLLGVPHLSVLAPSPFADPAALLRHAVLGQDRPVLFVEHKALYPAALVGADDPDLVVSAGPAVTDPTVVRNFRRGEPDVTVTCYGGAALVVAAAMRRLAAEEIRVEAVVPVVVSAPPVDTVASCAADRVLVVEEAPAGFGWSAEVSAAVTERMWDRLAAPVRRLAAQPTVIPAAPGLEDAVLPSAADVEEALIALL